MYRMPVSVSVVVVSVEYVPTLCSTHTHSDAAKGPAPMNSVSKPQHSFATLFGALSAPR